MATMTLNTKLNGIELRFEGKPSEAILKRLHECEFHFAWNNGKPYWWGRQNEQRLALAKELEDKKTTARKQRAKASDKADAKADTKAKAEVKLGDTVELGELSDKCTYNIKVVTCGKRKNRSVNGYKFTATCGERVIEFGVHKETTGTWTVDELTTGLSVGSSFEKRYLAINSIKSVELFKKIVEVLERK